MDWLSLALALVVGVVLGFWSRSGDFRHLNTNRDFWQKKALEYRDKWYQSERGLSAAEKQLIALRDQTPGRDNSGRFVKREKTSATNGCG